MKRKLKYLKQLHGTPQEMLWQVLNKNWVSKSKGMALETVFQYSQFLGSPIEKPNFRVYQNAEMYVPTPEMVKQFVYRIRSPEVRTMVLIAIETGASASEIWRLTWREVNLAEKTITIIGVKGHKTEKYPMDNELTTLLLQLPKNREKIFSIKDPVNIGKNIRDYRKKLVKETGNSDFNKIHFHSFRHFAISWYYFKTKDPFETQRFARHCNILNTQRYVHVVKSWVKENEFNVVYAETKEELTKYLSEGYTLVTKSEWGYCLTKPKSII